MKSITLCLIAVSVAVLLVNEVSCKWEWLADLEENNYYEFEELETIKSDRNLRMAGNQTLSSAIDDAMNRMSQDLDEDVREIEDSKIGKELSKLADLITDELGKVEKEVEDGFKNITGGKA
ncbi:uncharacterized protein LOC111047533 isoform X2 [Nilaparvata lugens]|uniref:uncharacterized protein LOC111047533 isoform X2 n=1 Tax=Nilaparvata lugens TaxID=108931 RepID=UPI00193EBF3D|nr:uncharacterized protein LOC111047533 isoform X2 [Nilaparvata lugens]